MNRFWILVILFPCVLFADTISLSGNPAVMTISTATAGSQPNSATNNLTTYNMSSLSLVRNINGKINTAMATGSTLAAQLAAPSGATSVGSVVMTTTAQNLVTGIGILTTANNLTVTYTISATVAAAKVTNATKTFTITIQ